MFLSLQVLPDLLRVTSISSLFHSIFLVLKAQTDCNETVAVNLMEARAVQLMLLPQMNVGGRGVSNLQSTWVSFNPSLKAPVTMPVNPSLGWPALVSLLTPPSIDIPSSPLHPLSLTASMHSLKLIHNLYLLFPIFPPRLAAAPCWSSASYFL